MAASIKTASAYNRLSQYAIKPGDKAYYYSSLVMTLTVTSPVFAYPWKDGQTENKYCTPINSHLSQY